MSAFPSLNIKSGYLGMTDDFECIYSRVVHIKATYHCKFYKIRHTEFSLVSLMLSQNTLHHFNTPTCVHRYLLVQVLMCGKRVL